MCDKMRGLSKADIAEINEAVGEYLALAFGIDPEIADATRKRIDQLAADWDARGQEVGYTKP